MPRKKPEPDHSKSTLTFTIETFDDPETGEPTQFGRFSRNWQDEEALDVLIDQLEAGRVTHKQALMQARKLEATTPDNLEIQNFIANRLWALGLQDEAAEVYERAFHRAQAHIPKGYTGQITWSEVDNRSFLRLAHGTLLGLMHKRDGKTAMALAQQMLAWCPMDNIGVRFLLGDIALPDGHREVLGLWIENTEGAKFWLKVFNDLKTRGLGDILIAVTDGLKGIGEALGAVFPATTLQTCIVHLIRNSLDYAGWKDRKLLAAALKPIYTAPSAEALPWPWTNSKRALGVSDSPQS